MLSFFQNVPSSFVKGSLLLLLGLVLICSCKRGVKQGKVSTETGFSDLHNSSLYRLFTEEDVRGLEDGKQALSLEGMRENQARLMLMSIGIPRFSMQEAESPSLTGVLAFLRKFREKSREYSDFHWVGERKGLERVLSQGQTAYTFALEGSWLLEGEERWLDSLYEAGVRMLGMAHRFENEFFTREKGTADFVGNSPVFLKPETGFTPQGKAFFERLLKSGIAVDLSHFPEKAFWEAVEINAGRQPLFASHSNSFALCSVPRNLKTKQIRAIAESGGLIGICFHQPMLGQFQSKPGIADVANHIIAVMKIAGEDHVCLGSDLEGLIQPALGLEKISGITQLREELQQRGVSPEQVEKVMWRNALQIFE